MQNKGLWVFVGVCGTLLLAVFIGILISPSPAPRSTLPGGETFGSVTNKCEAAIRSQLVSPGTMKIVRRHDVVTRGNAILHSIDIDSQNSFGALLRSRWGCMVENGRVVEAVMILD